MAAAAAETHNTQWYLPEAGSGAPLSSPAGVPALALPKQMTCAEIDALRIGRQRREGREQGLQRNGVGRDQTDRRPDACA